VSLRRPVCEEEATVADADSPGVVVQSVHMHRHAVACSTPRTEQIAAASAFAQEHASVLFSGQAGACFAYERIALAGRLGRSLSRTASVGLAAAQPSRRSENAGLALPQAGSERAARHVTGQDHGSLLV
jgi:hypothetical protein